MQFVQTRQCLKAPLQGTITLVSRRWHRIFYSEPELWRSLHLTVSSANAAAAAGQAQQWFASKSTLLHRVGGVVQHLVVADWRQTVGAGAGAQWASMQQLADQYGGWHLSSSVLAHLSPGALQSLRLHCEAVDEAAAAALQHFSGLLQLNLHCEGDVPSCVAAALPSLPQLQHLELAGSAMPQGLPAALQQLPQLTTLSCVSKAGSLPGLSAVFPLTQLRELWWEDAKQPAPARVDVQQLLAQLPHLEAWAIGKVMHDWLDGKIQVRDGMRLLRCCSCGAPLVEF